ncbi:MAG: hypothetical protein HOP11_03505 [Saprospiraceae bacterium]|nr:hypothetical protein [Saprospiraceae bacterium]
MNGKIYFHKSNLNQPIVICGQKLEETDLSENNEISARWINSNGVVVEARFFMYELIKLSAIPKPKKRFAKAY